ncbi:MAG: signal peptidase I [Acidobacteriota bacterium]
MIRPDAPPKSALRDYFETIVICVIFVLFGRAFVFQQSKIPTGSMEDTLLIGDYIMVNKFVYGAAPTALERALLPFQPVQHGDIMVFKFPREPEKDYIKRIIALPGELLEIVKGQIYVNGEALDEPYKVHKDPHRSLVYYHESSEDFCRNRENCGPVRIPPGHYFAMGDNRDKSADSRVWGPVPRQNIKGRAFLIWWSFDEPRNTYRETRFIDRLRHIAYKITHLISRTRWGRIFQVIH